MGFLDGIGAGIGGMIGGFLGRDDRRREADHAADRNDQMAREQMAFQERMSNSAYQRATTDMKAAGINPMVAYTQGGASTPSGASGTAPLAQPTDIFGKALSSAIDAMRLDNETKGTQGQLALNTALGTKALADAEAAGASAKQSTVTTESIRSQLKAQKAEAEAREKKAKWDSKATDYDAIMNRVNRDSNSAGNVLNMLKGFKGNMPKGSMHIDKDGAILKQY